jgi:hypothetical protein
MVVIAAGWVRLDPSRRCVWSGVFGGLRKIKAVALLSLIHV